VCGRGGKRERKRETEDGREGDVLSVEVLRLNVALQTPISDFQHGHPMSAPFVGVRISAMKRKLDHPKCVDCWRRERKT